MQWAFTTAASSTSLFIRAVGGATHARSPFREAAEAFTTSATSGITKYAPVDATLASKSTTVNSGLGRDHALERHAPT